MAKLRNENGAILGTPKFPVEVYNIFLFILFSSCLGVFSSLLKNRLLAAFYGGNMTTLKKTKGHFFSMKGHFFSIDYHFFSRRKTTFSRETATIISLLSIPGVLKSGYKKRGARYTPLLVKSYGDYTSC